MRLNSRDVRILVGSVFCALIIGALPTTSFASVAVGVSINVAPPALPVYVQPPCPVPGYLWTPGYWAYGSFGYYWVPGVWVRPPRVGVLWTPGYWGYAGGAYVWHTGYWGPRVGFYGGVHYGFGYTGIGFVGGVWAGSLFRYNTAVVNVNRTVIHNTYIDRTVIRNRTVLSRASFNGPHGIRAVPTERQRQAMHETHFERTAEQLAHRRAASGNPAQRFSDNHGVPRTAAMNKINGRRYNQQGRIANGVGSGQLSNGETRHLEHREANFNHTVHAERHANAGSLTPQQRRQINQKQNRMSQSIYRDKHNAATRHYGNNEVGARQSRQQQRLAHGIGSGQIGAAGAARTEHREQHLNHRIAADRAAHGGRLTRQQRRKINQRQNRLSRHIYRQKHNAKHAAL